MGNNRLYVYTFSILLGEVIYVSFANVGIGIIANGDRSGSGDQVTETNITCNVSAHWLYVDHTEIFYVYKAVRRFSVDPQIDLILLLEYDPSLSSTMPSLLDTGTKPLIKLYKGNTQETKKMIYNTSLLYLNDTNVKFPTTPPLPYCKQETNASNIDITEPLFGDAIGDVPAKVLANLVKLQGWTTVYVFMDNTTERDTKILQDQLSLLGVVFVVYDVDKSPDLHGVLRGIYDASVNMKPEINFVLHCRFTNLMKILHTANDFDDSNNDSPTLLTLFSRWLAVVHDFIPFKAKTLEKLARDLSNVAIVIIPQFTPIHVENIKDRLEVMIAEVALRYQRDEINKTYILQHLSRALLSLDPVNHCTGFMIQTLLWTDHGRKFHEVGHADLHGNTSLTTELFPNIKYGYSGRQFVITTISYPPFVNKTIVNGTVEFEGVCIDLLKELARVLNFTYRLVDPPDNKWGSVDKYENDTYVFNGMIGQLQRQEVDIAAAPLAIIPEREAVVDFTYPIYHEYTTVVLKKPDPNANKWRTLVDPFKLNVLLFIGLSLPVVTVLVCLLEKYNTFYDHPENASALRLHHLHNSFWYMYGALLCQGGVHLPDSFAGRTIVSAWWIFCIIIVGTYCGNLIAFLTISKDMTPFNTLEEMAALKGQYKWGTLGGTNWEVIFTDSKLPDFRKIGDAMLEFNRSDPTIFHLTTKYHIERVKKGGYAWIGDKTTIELNMARECDLITIKEEFIPMKYGFALQQNSPHAFLFSEQVMKSQEAGLFEIWRRKWWPKTNFCSKGNMPVSKPISLADVQSAHYVCAVGVFVGTVAFSLELLIFKFRKRQHDHQDNSHTRENSNQKSVSCQTD